MQGRLLAGALDVVGRSNTVAWCLGRRGSEAGATVLWSVGLPDESGWQLAVKPLDVSQMLQ